MWRLGCFSGISDNPAVGVVSDLLVDSGGTVILSEIFELIGAENNLQRRCINKDVVNQLKHIVNRLEQKSLNSGIDIHVTNSSSGNIKVGIKTLEEKSLGSIYKEVIEYAENSTKNGLVVINGPAMI